MTEPARDQERELHCLRGLELGPVLADELVEPGVRHDGRARRHRRLAPLRGGALLLIDTQSRGGTPQTLGVTAAGVDEAELRLFAHLSVVELFACECRAARCATVEDDARLTDLSGAMHMVRLDIQQTPVLAVACVACEGQVAGGGGRRGEPSGGHRHCGYRGSCTRWAHCAQPLSDRSVDRTPWSRSATSRSSQ